MFSKTVIMNILCLIATFEDARAGYVPNLRQYEVNIEQDYVPKIWHFSTSKQSPALQEMMGAADFINAGGVCTRVIVFLGYKQPMDYLQVSCIPTDPFFGAVFTDQIWYFGSYIHQSREWIQVDRDYSKRIEGIFDDGNMKTCLKTWSVFKSGESTYPLFGKATETVTKDNNKECNDVINQKSFPPMLLYSADGDVTGYSNPSDVKLFNPTEQIGARVTTYRNGRECFRRLELLSKQRIIDAMKVSCGPMDDVKATEKAFYYGTIVMAKALDDPDMFMVICNPRYGKLVEPYKIKEPVFIKKTFKLIQQDKGYVSKKLSTTLSYIEDPDCAELSRRLGTETGKEIRVH